MRSPLSVTVAVAALAISGFTAASPGQRPHLRPLPGPLYGATVDDISNLSQIVASSQHLSQMPTTRVYFDVKEPASNYANAVRQLDPVSYTSAAVTAPASSARSPSPAATCRSPSGTA